MAHPAFGDAMEKPPNVFYTPPPASPSPGASVRPSASPRASTAPGAVPAPPVLPGASPGASARPSPSASPSPQPTPAPSIPPAFPNPSPPGSPGPGAQLPSPEPSPTPASEQPRVKVNADQLRHDRNAGVTTFRGNVKVNYGQISLTSEELNVNQKEQVIFTDTRFTLTQPDPQKPGQQQVITGTGLEYHYATREATVNGANLSTPAEYPGQTVYVRAKTLKGYGQDHFEGMDAVFTTCSELLEEKVPHYHVETRHLQYFAGDRIVAWDNKIYINGRYVFWLPVWVIPLKGERNSLNVGRSEIEGFWLRSQYNYALPALNNGFWLNDGRVIANGFEKKGLGLGVEHNVRWGYDAATYLYLYGLVQPDRSNLLPANSTLTEAQEDAMVARNQKLFGLSGTFFQDHQLAIEHRQRLPFDIETDIKVTDDNIYDPLTQNVRINRRTSHFDLKDQVPSFGNLNYDMAYDGTRQRGQQVPVQAGPTAQTSESDSNRIRLNTAFTTLGTDFRLSSQIDRTQQLTQQVGPKGSFGTLQASEGTAPVEYEVRTLPGATTTNVTNNYNATSTLGPNTRASLTVPHRINLREEAPPTPAPAGASPAPMPSPSPMEQQLEPQLEVTHQIKDVGSLSMVAQKFVDLTQPAPGLTAKQQAEALKRQNKLDRLPELTFTPQTLFQDWQPITSKVAYGRLFEYSSIDPNKVTDSINRFFPGDYINRLNVETSLGSKALPIGFNSKLDFGGTGYRQFVYSTRDAQYAIDERVRLSTDWTDKIQSNFNYTNNLTPDPRDLPFGSRLTNNSPFQQDRISLSKQTRLTGDFNVRNDPFFTYALRGGYDYQNLLYDNLSSELTWRARLFGVPFGLSLNGQYDIADEPALKLESKTLNVRYLPQIPTWGIAGKWLPVTGTLTVRSTEDVFGGAFGADKILPGWQFDNSMSYDFERGLWQTLINRLYITFGNDWRSHVQLVLGGYYDTQEKEYRFSTIGVTKDLHDFVLSFQYDRLASFYSLSLTMVAFPSQPLNFSSNTFNRNATPGGAGF